MHKSWSFNFTRKTGKVLAIGLFFTLALFSFGCSKNKRNGKFSDGENLNSEAGFNVSDYVDDFEPAKPESNTDEEFNGEKIAVDLTKMSSTMVYAEVFNMLIMPEEYNGKIIKVRGTFSTFVPNGKKDAVTTVVVSDALGCCKQGLEFVFAGDSSDRGGAAGSLSTENTDSAASASSSLKKQDLPAEDQEIEIIGRFILTQTEEGLEYFYLDCKDLKVI